MANTIEDWVNAEGPDPLFLYGIDISTYQGKANSIDWTQVCSAGTAFVYCKATEGVTIQDSQFATHWNNLRGVVPRGAYHFFRGGNDGFKQAQNFLSVIGDDFCEDDLPPVIDVEAVNASVPVDKQIEYVAQWVDEVGKALHCYPMIYTSRHVVRDYFKGTKAWCSFPLWTVDYRMSQTLPPKMPYGWDNWKLWQFSDKCIVPSFKAGVDVDRFNGNADAFTLFIENSHYSPDPTV